MNVLVLGGNGFLGSHLVDALLKEGCCVRVADQYAERYREPLPDVDYRIVPLCSSDDFVKVLGDIDCVYHLASTTVPSTSNQKIISDIHENLIFTIMLLEAMVKVGLKKIVYVSSGGAVYGKPDVSLVEETHPLNPISSYGVVKVAIEKYFGMFQYDYDMHPVILRPACAYGPRQGNLGAQGVIGTFLHCVKNNEKLVVWGDGGNVRDYIFIRDLVSLCVSAGMSEATGVFNAGGGVGYSLCDVIACIKQVTGVDVDPVFEDARVYDVSKIVLSNKKAKSYFGWQPKVSLHDGVAECWHWLQSLKV